MVDQFPGWVGVPNCDERQIPEADILQFYQSS
jgi:hypothetical protein